MKKPCEERDRLVEQFLEATYEHIRRDAATRAARAAEFIKALEEERQAKDLRAEALHALWQHKMEHSC